MTAVRHYNSTKMAKPRTLRRKGAEGTKCNLNVAESDKSYRYRLKGRGRKFQLNWMNSLTFSANRLELECPHKPQLRSLIRKNLPMVREICSSRLIKTNADEPISSGTFGTVYSAEYRGMKTTVKRLRKEWTCPKKLNGVDMRFCTRLEYCKVSATTKISYSFLVSVQRWSHSASFFNSMALVGKVLPSMRL